MGTIFRPFVPADKRSDRSARDRQRHRQKIRDSIRDNISDIIAEESIIGRDKNKIVKVPIRSIKEYRFIYGENAPGVAQGTGNEKPGDVVGKAPPGAPDVGIEIQLGSGPRSRWTEWSHQWGPTPNPRGPISPQIVGRRGKRRT